MNKPKKEKKTLSLSDMIGSERYGNEMMIKNFISYPFRYIIFPRCYSTICIIHYLCVVSLIDFFSSSDVVLHETTKLSHD